MARVKKAFRPNYSRYEKIIDMHVHVSYVNNMRTTIDIPAKLRQRLIAEAAKRNLKGFSFIIVNALEEYFESDTTQSSASEIRKLRGSLSKAEYGEAMALLKEGRRGWRE